MAVNTYKVGLLVGKLMRELLTEDEFHKGYQDAMKVDGKALKILRDALKISPTQMASVKVTAIKAHRDETGKSLKEALEDIQEMMTNLEQGLI